jgi:serine/threonine-protein kinase
MPADNLRRVVGRHSIFGPIASGGMATVHYGRLDGPVGFSRTVAIKRMHPHLAAMPALADAFVDEARLAARVKHPNVVPTIDVLHEDGEVLLVMEYVHGVSLSDLLEAASVRQERIPPKIAASILCGALHGLHAAHEAGIVHRDVSPQNILIGIDGVARVVDFGVAKARGRMQTTQEGQLKGKLAYMSPEQILAMEVTRQTDVYAAAVVLWETLTCRRLFAAENEGALMKQVLDGAVEPPSDVPEGIAAIVMKGLARDVRERFATAKELAIALEAEAGVTPAWQVGEWVERLGEAQLASRQAKLDAMERDVVLEEREVVSTVPTATEAGPRTTAVTVRGIPRPPPSTSEVRERKRPWVVWGVALVALVGMVFVAVRFLAAPEPVAAPTVTAAETTVAVVSSPPTPVVSAPPAPVTSASVSVSKPRRPAPVKNCDPPYTEKNGIRYPKPGCL